MDSFYNRAGFCAEGDPPYVWCFDLLGADANASVAPGNAGVDGLYELVGALAARGGDKTAEKIEDILVSISDEAFRPLLRHVIDLAY